MSLAASPLPQMGNKGSQPEEAAEDYSQPHKHHRQRVYEEPV